MNSSLFLKVLSTFLTSYSSDFQRNTEIFGKNLHHGFEKSADLLMPCPFTGPKKFCSGPNFLSQHKNLFTYCASHKHFVPDKKMICIQQNCFLCWHKSFWRGTKYSQIFGLAQKIWTITKHFGTCKRTRPKRVKQIW